MAPSQLQPRSSPRRVCSAAIALSFDQLTDQSTDISASLLDTLVLMEQYTAASYCKANQASVGDEVTCPVGNACPRVDAASTLTTAEFEK